MTTYTDWQDKLKDPAKAMAELEGSRFAEKLAQAYMNDTGYAIKHIIEREIKTPAAIFGNTTDAFCRPYKSGSNFPAPGKVNRTAVLLPESGTMLALTKLLNASFQTGSPLLISIPPSLSNSGMLIKDWSEENFPGTAFFPQGMTPDNFIRQSLAADDITNMVVFAADSWMKKWRNLFRLHHTRLIFEGTGKNPFILLPGADITHAVRKALQGGLINGGQSAYASELFFIHDSLYNGFAEGLVDAAAELYCGRQEDERTDIGPVFLDAILNNIIMQVTDAKQRGADILTGGKLFETAGAGRQGYLPTVLSGCTMQMKITRHTSYGPVFPLISFTAENELIEMLDQLVYALDAAVFGDASPLLTGYLQKNYRNIYADSTVTCPENCMSQLVDGGFRNAAYIWEWQGDQFAQREGPRRMAQELGREE